MRTRFHDLQQMLSSMDALRDTFNLLSGQTYEGLPRFEGGWGIPDGWPKMNLYDTGEQLEMRVELPGFSREDIQIKVQGNYLEISGSRKAAGPEGYTVHRRERENPTFTRSMTLPIEVDSGQATASIKNGILSLVLPKSVAARPQQITIR
jgi:HSP20 family protein